MVELAFFGGVNEIGGNKILLEDDDARVFFDFGQSFTMGNSFFIDWLRPRATRGLDDYLEFQLLPRLSGLYAEDQLKHTDIAYAKPEFDVVFLSHAHFDHMNHIQFLDPEIPIYLGAGTKLFLEAAETTSRFCDYKKHDYHTFRTGSKIRIGRLTVEPIHVDHSIPASYGFLIHTSEGSLVYTGDLRVHGPRKDMTREFIRRASESEPIALICEGTRMLEKERRKNHSERQVEKASGRIVSSTSKIAFVARYSRDMDRFRSFHTVAKENGRSIAISPKTALLLDKLTKDERLDLPDPLRDKNISVYYKRKKSGRFDERDYFTWERKYMEKMVTHEFVHENQGKLLMDLDFYQFTELVDIQPDQGCHFIHSMSEPHSEEDIEDQIMHNWLEHFKIRFHQLHASGHLPRQQLTNLINRVKPKKVFPIHTENPHLFEKIGDGVQKIKQGKKYHL